jgi:hypothetical protein
MDLMIQAGATEVDAKKETDITTWGCCQHTRACVKFVSREQTLIKVPAGPVAHASSPGGDKSHDVHLVSLICAVQNAFGTAYERISPRDVWQGWPRHTHHGQRDLE